MAATQINFSVDQSIKLSADTILQGIGLTLPDALRMFLRQVIACNGLPLSTNLADLQSRSQRITKLSKEESEKFFDLLSQSDEFDAKTKSLIDYHKNFQSLIKE